MRYLEFKEQLNKFIVFTSKDALNLDPNFNLSLLSKWQKKGYIRKLRKGKYVFSDLEIKEEFLFLISNELLAHSYVSLESALSWYGLIPEGVRQITAVSTLRSVVYDSKVAIFKYRKIKAPAFMGYVLVDIAGFNKPYKLATIEKSIVDFLYLHNDINSMESIESLRFNKEVFAEKVDVAKLLRYSEAFENKSLERRVNKFIKYFKK